MHLCEKNLSELQRSPDIFGDIEQIIPKNKKMQPKLHKKHSPQVAKPFNSISQTILNKGLVFLSKNKNTDCEIIKMVWQKYFSIYVLNSQLLVKYILFASKYITNDV